jgi:hypothetical protein
MPDTKPSFEQLQQTNLELPLFIRYDRTQGGRPTLRRRFAVWCKRRLAAWLGLTALMEDIAAIHQALQQYTTNSIHAALLNRTRQHQLEHDRLTAQRDADLARVDQIIQLLLEQGTHLTRALAMTRDLAGTTEMRLTYYERRQPGIGKLRPGFDRWLQGKREEYEAEQAMKAQAVAEAREAAMRQAEDVALPQADGQPNTEQPNDVLPPYELATPEAAHVSD